MIPEHVIQAINERADIFQVVSGVVALKRKGSAYVGLCPFHSEKTGSFTIDQGRGTYHCFGCGAHGGAIKFVQQTQQLNFPEAVRHLGALFGVEVPEERLSPEQRQARQRAKSLAEVHDQLTSFYQTLLGRSPKAQRYLKERALSEESARAFKLGWAPNDVELFARWMSEQKISADSLLEIGALRSSREDEARGDARLNGHHLRFKERLVCPIFNLRGHSVGFSGRIINPNSKAPKYLNTTETPLFTKGRSLYGLSTAITASARDPDGPVILCEGNLDVVSLWQAGFPKCVAPMGTALTEDQVRLLKRLSAKVIVLMDGDAAGQKSAFKSLPLMIQQGLKPRFGALPEGEDPDSFLKTRGPKAMRALLEGARPLFDCYLEHLISQHPQDVIGQSEVMERALPLIVSEPDDHLRPLYLNSLAQLTGLDRAYLTDRLKEALSQALEPQALNASHSYARSRYTSAQAQTSAQQSPRQGASHHQTSAPHDEYNGYNEYEGYNEYDGYDGYDEYDGYDGYDGYEGGSAEAAQGVSRQAQPHDHTSSSAQSGSAVRSQGDLNAGGARRFGKRADETPAQWWMVEAAKAQERERAKRFGGSTPTSKLRGEIDIKTHDERAPFEPPPTPLTPPSSFPGYERETLQLLYYHPELLAEMIERGAERLCSHELIGRVIHALYESYQRSTYVSLPAWLDEQPPETQGVALFVREALASPPPKMLEEERRRALQHAIKKLTLRQLELRLKEATRALAQLTSEREQLTRGPHTEADLSSFYERFQEQQRRYEEARQAFNQAKRKPQGPAQGPAQGAPAQVSAPPLPLPL